MTSSGPLSLALSRRLPRALASLPVSLYKRASPTSASDPGHLSIGAYGDKDFSSLTFAELLRQDNTSSVTLLALLLLVAGFVAAFLLCIAIAAVLARTNRPRKEALSKSYAQAYGGGAASTIGGSGVLSRTTSRATTTTTTTSGALHKAHEAGLYQPSAAGNNVRKSRRFLSHAHANAPQHQNQDESGLLGNAAPMGSGGIARDRDRYGLDGPGFAPSSAAGAGAGVGDGTFDSLDSSARTAVIAMDDGDDQQQQQAPVAMAGRTGAGAGGQHHRVASSGLGFPGPPAVARRGASASAAASAAASASPAGAGRGIGAGAEQQHPPLSTTGYAPDGSGAVLTPVYEAMRTRSAASAHHNLAALAATGPPPASDPRRASRYNRAGGGLNGGLGAAGNGHHANGLATGNGNSSQNLLLLEANASSGALLSPDSTSTHFAHPLGSSPSFGRNRVSLANASSSSPSTGSTLGRTGAGAGAGGGAGAGAGGQGQDRRSRIQSVGAGVYRKSQYLATAAADMPPSPSAFSMQQHIATAAAGAGGYGGGAPLAPTSSDPMQQQQQQRRTSRVSNYYNGASPAWRKSGFTPSLSAGGGGVNRFSRYAIPAHPHPHPERTPPLGGLAALVPSASSRVSVYGLSEEMERSAIASAQREGFGAGPPTPLMPSQLANANANVGGNGNGHGASGRSLTTPKGSATGDPLTQARKPVPGATRAPQQQQGGKTKVPASYATRSSRGAGHLGLTIDTGAAGSAFASGGGIETASSSSSSGGGGSSVALDSALSSNPFSSNAATTVREHSPMYTALDFPPESPQLAPGGGGGAGEGHSPNYAAAYQQKSNAAVRDSAYNPAPAHYAGLHPADAASAGRPPSMLRTYSSNSSGSGAASTGSGAGSGADLDMFATAPLPRGASSYAME